MNSSRREHRFLDVHALASALAGEIRVDLTDAIEARGTASMIVSGGDKLIPLYEALREEPVEWDRVWIGLADERWVDSTDPHSNEGLIREQLLKKGAGKAHFIGIKNPATTPENGSDWAWRAMTRLSRPYDIVVLGMGTDGHFASLVPNSLGLMRALDLDAAPACVAMHALDTPHSRVSQNLAALLDARRIALMMVGEEQWSVFQRARLTGPMSELPIRALLIQQQTPIDVYWSP